MFIHLFFASENTVLCWIPGTFSTDILCTHKCRDLLNSGNTSWPLISWRSMNASRDEKLHFKFPKKVSYVKQVFLRYYWNLCSWKNYVVSSYFLEYSLPIFLNKSLNNIYCFYITDWNALINLLTENEENIWFELIVSFSGCFSSCGLDAFVE